MPGESEESRKQTLAVHGPFFHSTGCESEWRIFDEFWWFCTDCFAVWELLLLLLLVTECLSEILSFCPSPSVFFFSSSHLDNFTSTICRQPRRRQSFALGLFPSSL